MESEPDYLAFVDSSPAVELAAELSSSAIASVAAAFAASIQHAHDLAVLPQYLVTRAGVEIALSGYVVDGDLSPAQSRAVAQLKRMSSEEAVARSLRAVRRAVATETWTAFECMSNDARDLIRPGYSRQPKGLTAIKQSYLTMFRADRPDLIALFDGADLTELAELRHLLVHQGGIVDTKFRSRISGSEAIGELVRLDGGRIKRLATAAVRSGVSLLRGLREFTN